MALPLINDPENIRYDFDLKQGSTWRTNFLWLNDDTAVDLTGATASATFKGNYGSSTTVFALSAGSGAEVVNPTSGEFQMEITAAASSAVDFASLLDGCDEKQSVVTLVYDYDITDGTDTVTILSGLCRFWREV